MALYPKNKSKALDMKLYRNPTAEYRAPLPGMKLPHGKEGAALTEEALKQMGFGGGRIFDEGYRIPPEVSSLHADALFRCFGHGEGFHGAL